MKNGMPMPSNKSSDIDKVKLESLIDSLRFFYDSKGGEPPDSLKNQSMDAVLKNMKPKQVEEIIKVALDLKIQKDDPIWFLLHVFSSAHEFNSELMSLLDRIKEISIEREQKRIAYTSDKVFRYSLKTVTKEIKAAVDEKLNAESETRVEQLRKLNHSSLEILKKSDAYLKKIDRKMNHPVFDYAIPFVLGCVTTTVIIFLIIHFTTP